MMDHRWIDRSGEKYKFKKMQPFVKLLSTFFHTDIPSLPQMIPLKLVERRSDFNIAD